MDTRSVARTDRAFPELSAPCAARVDEVLAALARLQTANAAIAARQLVQATRRGDQHTRRIIRRTMWMVA